MQKIAYYTAVNQLVKEVLNRYFANRVSWNDRKDYQNDIMEKIISKGLNHDALKGSMKTWVYQIVKNHIIDQERKSKKSKVFFKDDLSYYDSAEDDFDMRMKEELEDRFTIYGQLLGSLPNETDADIIQLFYGENLSNKEVAERLSLPEGSLAMRRNRIKKRLKKTLELRKNKE
jgi:RNA polymerase sigma factor (sigma-70 family)